MKDRDEKLNQRAAAGIRAGKEGEARGPGGSAKAWGAAASRMAARRRRGVIRRHSRANAWVELLTLNSPRPPRSQPVTSQLPAPSPFSLEHPPLDLWPRNRSLQRLPATREDRPLPPRVLLLISLIIW